MRRRSIFWFLILLPWLIMVSVNMTAPQPTHQYMRKKCTRFCHDRSCPHFKASTGRGKKVIESIYKKNIGALQNNSLGLSYEKVNLLIYVLFIPTLMIILLWLALKKK